MSTILASKAATEITTIVILALTVVLAVIITQRYAKKKSRSLLFWGIGIWLFALGVLLEILFAFGLYSGFLIRAYLLVVALIVEALALGSIQLVKKKWIRQAYYIFVLISTALLIYSLAASKVGNLIVSYVVSGAPSNSIVITSSIITFPAAVILIVVAIMGYMKRRDLRLISIIIGVIIVSIAGTLYIIQYPALLYIAELIGILLLWYGFI